MAGFETEKVPDFSDVVSDIRPRQRDRFDGEEYLVGDVVTSQQLKKRGIFLFVRSEDWFFLLMATLIMCFASTGTSLQTVIYGKILKQLTLFYKNETNAEQFMDKIKTLCGTIMLLGVGRMVASWVGIFAWMKFGERQSGRARSVIYRLLIHRDVLWFESSTNVMGDLAQVNRCIEELRAGTSEVLGLFVQTLSSAIALFVTAMIHSWALTLVIISTFPIMALFGWLFGRMTCNAAETENELTSRASKVLDWSLSATSTVRLLNGKYCEMVRFNKIIDLSAKAYYKVSNAIAANIGVIKTLSMMMFVQGFWFGTYLIKLNKLQLNQAFTCFSSCLLLGSEISEISVLMATFNKSQAAVKRIIDILDTVASEDNEIGIYPSTCWGKVQVQNVSFGFPTRPDNVIRNVNIEFQEDTINYIVGKSGTGKTTLAQLLVGLYKPTLGYIKLDGHSLQTLNWRWITDNVTYVLQNLAMLKTTLKENLKVACGNRFKSMEDVPDSIINDAIDFCLLREVVDSLPNGIEEDMTSRSLSGGQMQRIALARAKIRDTPILVLDEPYSALDCQTKNEIFHHIRQWRRGKTTIVITHELSSIEDGDFLIVMEAGTVKYQGPRELVNDNLLFMTEATTKVSSDADLEILSSQNTLVGEPNECHNACLESQSSAYMERPQDVLSLFEILKFYKKTTDSIWLSLLGMLASLIGGVTNPVFAFCSSKLLVQMVQVSATGTMTKSLTIWSIVVILIAVLNGISHYFSVMIMSVVSEKWIVGLRKASFEKLQEQSVSFFGQETTKASELTTLLMNDTKDLRSLVSEFLCVALNLVVIFSVSIAWAIVAGWKLALVGISFVPIVIVINYSYMLLLTRSENNYKSNIAMLENHIHETVSKLKFIKCFYLHKMFINGFEDKLLDVSRAGLIRAIYTGFGVSLSGLIMSLATGTIFYYGMKLVSEGTYRPSQLFQVLTLLSFSMTTSTGLLAKLPDIARGQRAGTYIMKLLSLKASRTENEGSIKPILGREPLIKFDNVSFKYPNNHGNEEMVLKTLSFNVCSNETVAIVGESGSGKSTIASLISRLQETSDKSIFISNFDLNSIDIDWLRDTVTVVEQFPEFFEGSIYENLIYGLPECKVSSAEIENTLRMVYIDTFVLSLPEGLNTRIGEGERALISGGQLQRLAIARALLRQPKILILDECTSNLDPMNTRCIIDMINLNLKQKDITIILLTHEPELMKIASKVLVLKDGTVAEQGDFETLYSAKKELYCIASHYKRGSTSDTK